MAGTVFHCRNNNSNDIWINLSQIVTLTDEQAVLSCNDRLECGDTVLWHIPTEAWRRLLRAFQEWGRARQPVQSPVLSMEIHTPDSKSAPNNSYVSGAVADTIARYGPQFT